MSNMKYLFNRNQVTMIEIEIIHNCYLEFQFGSSPMSTFGIVSKSFEKQYKQGSQET